ncbi:glycosyl transferase [Robertkochia solimangrovi]|nr:glycosyl transferase [Robertkochia solimangrovi]
MSTNTRILGVFVALKFILQYSLIHPVYDLQRDEYLYLDQANHLAWGYMSVPPLTSWVALFIKFLGNSVFVVKFFPALFGVLTLIVVWKTIKHLGGGRYALILGGTCVLLSSLLRLNTLFQPNSFDVLSWTTLYYCFIRYLDAYKPKWIYHAAIVFALGFLNKYNIVFLVLGMIPAILLTRHRIILKERSVYLAILLALLLILPNLIWQFNYDLPVYKHMLELRERQLVHVARKDFLMSQLLFFTGALPVLVSAFYALIFYKPYRKYLCFLWAFIFTIVVFLYFRAKDYYAIGLYPVYIAYGTVFLSNSIGKQAGKLLKPALLLFPVAFFALMSRVAFPNHDPEYIIAHQDKYERIGMLRWEDGKNHEIPQDFADMLGWKELAIKVDSASKSFNNKKPTLILCDNYGQAGAINYYSELNLQAVSFNADYIYWFDLQPEYANLIRVKYASEVLEEFEKTSPYFEKANIFDSVTHPYARERGTTIFTFQNASISINDRIKSEIAEELGTE